MEKNQFCVPLNLPDIRDQIRPEYIEELLGLLQKYPFYFTDFQDKQVPPLAIELFKQLGLTPSLLKMNLFSSPPLEAQTIHIDGDPTNPEKYRPFAINWVWGGKTVMRWFDVLTEVPPYMHQPGSKHIFTRFTEDQVKLKHQSTLTGATLVNIVHPHRVINASKEQRFCFSMCSEENLTWEEITDLCYKHGLVRE
jgi:hypothetical protein